MTNPERIYGWQNSQLSIARHYGSIKFNGHTYFISFAEEGQPLVREDVAKREAKAAKAARKKALQDACLFDTKPTP